ncbi:MAG: hypothetical protein EA375_04955 [Acholeplasmataceae bacterium]|nr:MAG: hypothetical protein EA375_04955 [Acholeplasmataceae bacterium]
MRLLTTLHDKAMMKTLAPFAGGFVVGNDATGTRLTVSFSLSDLNAIIDEAGALHQEVFLQANRLFSDQELDRFTHDMRQLDLDRVTGVIVSDLGAVRLLKAWGHAGKVVYHPDTLLTNRHDFNFLSREGIFGAFVAKEITLADIKTIAGSTSYALFMHGHGHLSMFYTKRQLVETYMRFHGDDHPYHDARSLRLIEETRLDDAMPVLEDEAGTHVFRAKVMSSLDDLQDLAKLVDYLLIDTIFKDDDYALKVLPLYHVKEKNDAVIKVLQQTYDETWDDGFLHQKTIYLTKG